MNTINKIKLLEDRLQKLTVNDKNNYWICRKIKRQILNLQKKLE